MTGYGVEMAAKNMEYKSMDDIKRFESDESGDRSAKSTSAVDFKSAADSDAETEGFMFSRLLKRKPALATALRAFQDELIAYQESRAGEMKAWDMNDLGIQAAKRVLTAENPVLALTQLSGN
eukprot:SAG31_NODE_24402_length_482_cov_0.921671_1_plen_121_part_10